MQGTDQQGSEDLITVGRISGLYGVKGWVKIFSHTEPRENILQYSPWRLKKGDGTWCPVEVEDGRAHGQGIVAKLRSCNAREQAAGLVGSDIAIHREQLAPREEGEYYWIDLIGLEVVNVQGERLGVVENLLSTVGANDVLVVRGASGDEILIPYVADKIVVAVDLERKRIEVDWQADF